MTATLGDLPEHRIAALDWNRLAVQIESDGYATTGPLLTPQQCAQLVARYDDAEAFRRRIVMARHGFGQGEYQYFRYPLEPLVATIRETAYTYLAPIANRWAERLGRPAYPSTLVEMLERCHSGGQLRPTPLLLRYGPGDYNCLHADLYGEHVFPFQLAILLSDPQSFSGGEFVLVENRPRMQSRVHVVPLEAAGGVIFAVNVRPVAGSRGYYRTTLRHGVSPVRSGRRFTLGVIFHDAM